MTGRDHAEPLDAVIEERYFIAVFGFQPSENVATYGVPRLGRVAGEDLATHDRERNDRLISKIRQGASLAPACQCLHEPRHRDLLERQDGSHLRDSP
jgi:hypothetical protein